MYTTTMEIIEKTEDNIPETFKHFLYLVKDGDVVLYVGRSYDPVDRLQQHLGISGRYGNYSADDLGLVYFEEKPESLKWQVEIYTVDDCLPFVKKHIMSYITHYTEERYLSQEGLDGAIDFAEQALIHEHRPCLNVIHNQNATRLPAHYKRNHPTISSAMFLDI